MRSKRRTAIVFAAVSVMAAACGGGVSGPKAPVYTYNALGFSFGRGGKLIAISRQGLKHRGDASGRVAEYVFRDGKFVATARPLIDERNVDERSVAGGISPSRALIVFYARQDPATQMWEGIRAARIAPDGTVVTSVIPTAPDGSYSPYGPLVTLPSGRLMQTVYGWTKHSYRVRALFSSDDGRTWTSESVIDASTLYRPTESAVALVSGVTDATAHLIAVSKTVRTFGSRVEQSLIQSTSTDGGRTWKQRGAIPVTKAASDVIPWIAPLGGGRIALVWIDRASLTLKASTARGDQVFDHPQSWPAPRTIYTSRLTSGRDKDISDFGYPSIARTGPSDADVFVVFYDTLPSTKKEDSPDLPSAVDLEAVRLFGAAK